MFLLVFFLYIKISFSEEHVNFSLFVSALIRQLTDWELTEMIIATLVHIESDERSRCSQGINRSLVGQLTNKNIR
jgi:hypothetical protein